MVTVEVKTAASDNDAVLRVRFSAYSVELVTVTGIDS